MTGLQIIIGIVAWLSAAVFTWSIVYVSTGGVITKLISRIVLIAIILLFASVIYFATDWIIGILESKGMV